MSDYIKNFVFSEVIPAFKSIGLAVMVLVVGMIVIKWGGNKLKVIFDKSKMDVSLKPFIISLIDALMKILLLVAIVGILGIPTSSFVAVLASAGLAIGLAFQGSLSNIAGGVLLLTTKPFAVGDFIEVNGQMGTVEGIKILQTELVTPDNKVIVIPNGGLANSSIVNFSKKETRRVDFKFGVSYDANNSEVMAILKDVISKQAPVLKDPEPFVRMSEHGDSAIMYTVRVWVKAKDYWDVHFNVIEEVKKQFDEKNISIPYPQMDVHMINN